MTRYYSRERSGTIQGGTVPTKVDFGSTGIATALDADVLRLFADVYELGSLGVNTTEGTAGNAAVTATVPTGKYWRLLGLFHSLVNDATVANRAVVVKTRNAADTVIDTITHANVAASTTAKRTTLFGTAAKTGSFVVGNEAVAAQGTLTIAEPVTDADTFTIDGTVFILRDAQSGQDDVGKVVVLTGGSEANTKLAIVTAINGHLDTVSAAAFSGDACVLTATAKGTAGNAIATTETFTHASNIFDAATLGTTTAGVDAADKLGGVDYPTSGNLLGPGFDVNISVTNGVAGDAYDTYLFYEEFSSDPS